MRAGFPPFLRKPPHRHFCRHAHNPIIDASDSWALSEHAALVDLQSFNASTLITDETAPARALSLVPCLRELKRRLRRRHMSMQPHQPQLVRASHHFAASAPTRLRGREQKQALIHALDHFVRRLDARVRLAQHGARDAGCLSDPERVQDLPAYTGPTRSPQLRPSQHLGFVMDEPIVIAIGRARFSPHPHDTARIPVQPSPMRKPHCIEKHPPLGQTGPRSQPIRRATDSPSPSRAAQQPPRAPRRRGRRDATPR
ncbi:hypothetical protein V8E36_004217 [Tilletia maclaganii]